MMLFLTVRVTSLANPNPFHIAASLVDSQWRTWQSANLLVRPDGWEVPKHLAEQYEITSRDASLHGVPIATVMRLVKALTENATEWYAFNADAAAAALQQGMTNAGAQTSWLSRQIPAQCVMKAGSPFVGAKTDDGQERASRLSGIFAVLRDMDLPDKLITAEQAMLIEVTKELKKREAFP